MTIPMAELPSPSTGVWHLGPLPIRAYALCIAAGIIVALVLTQRRWQNRGGDPEQVTNIVVWAVPFGIVGGRIYHLITDPELYFVRGRNPWQALEIWHGGLGIWGAVARRCVGALIACRRVGVSLPALRRTRSRPGLVLAQAHRPVGQLLQPGAVRTAYQPALGGADRPRPPPGRHAEHRYLPADVPLRVTLGRRGRRARHLGRTPLPPRTRPGIRALRRRVYRRTWLGRGAARRPRQPLLRTATERLDLAGRVRRVSGLPAAKSRSPRVRSGHLGPAVGSGAGWRATRCSG